MSRVAIILLALILSSCYGSDKPPTMLYGDLDGKEPRFILQSTDRYSIPDGPGEVTGRMHVATDIRTGRSYLIVQSFRTIAVTPLLERRNDR